LDCTLSGTKALLNGLREPLLLLLLLLPETSFEVVILAGTEVSGGRM
jgi:hypothetical protein